MRGNLYLKYLIVFTLVFFIFFLGIAVFNVIFNSQEANDMILKYFNLIEIKSNIFIIPTLYIISSLIIALTFIYQREFNYENVKTQKLARFDNIFFELLKIYEASIDVLNTEKKKHAVIRHGEFRHPQRYINSINEMSTIAIIFASFKERYLRMPGEDELKKLEECYEKILYNLGHSKYVASFLTSVQDLLKYIYESRELLDDDKHLYYRLVIDKLDASQRKLIFYYKFFQLHKKSRLYEDFKFIDFKNIEQDCNFNKYLSMYSLLNRTHRQLSEKVLNDSPKQS